MVIAITTEECVSAGVAVEVVSAAFGVDEVVSITATKFLQVISLSVIGIVAANEGVIAGACIEIMSVLVVP